VYFFNGLVLFNHKSFIIYYLYILYRWSKRFLDLYSSFVSNAILTTCKNTSCRKNGIFKANTFSLVIFSQFLEIFIYPVISTQSYIIHLPEIKIIKKNVEKYGGTQNIAVLSYVAWADTSYFPFQNGTFFDFFDPFLLCFSCFSISFFNSFSFFFKTFWCFGCTPIA
jgi:hypothetical protein